jgi:REP element-mobilizing transposase RayT
MARQPRVVVAGGTYHVFSRGNRKQPITEDQLDYSGFIRRLRKEVLRREWRCHAYCVMPNHFHLLLDTPIPNLSEGMQQLKGAYAQALNYRHGFEGHLFGGRFGSRLVDSDAYFIWVLRYIARNPVDAGLCVRPDEWPWSSYRALIGKASRSDFVTYERVLSYFGADEATAGANLERYVRDGYLLGHATPKRAMSRGLTPDVAASDA